MRGKKDYKRGQEPYTYCGGWLHIPTILDICDWWTLICLDPASMTYYLGLLEVVQTT